MKKKIFILVLCLTLLYFTFPVQAQEDNVHLVEEIKDILWKHYFEPVPFNLLSQTTVSDVIATLNDPYTKYFNEQEFRDFWLSLEGKFGGIGVTIEIVNNQVIITEVIPDTPAARVNIQKGDIITHLDNRPLINMDMEEIKDLFRGKPGTYLKLRTYRPSTHTYLSYLLIREYIVIKPLESSTLAKNIGYIKLLDFNQEAAQQFSKELNKFKENGVKGLILDLRDNPGGLLGAALDISRELLPPGPFVKLYYRGQKPELITTVGSHDLLPLIVLVNEDTASAAEILAGAIQDRQAGIIIGTNTYGKATVQSLVPLVNGGALKFTSGKYLTPNGRQINKIGLKPDFYITDSHDQIIEAIWMLNNQVHKSLTFQLNNEVFLVNGRNNKFAVKPYLAKGHFMVPLRATVESLGGKVKFTPPNKIEITLGENNIKLNLASRYFTYNGQTHYLPIKPVLKNQHTIIPVRTIAELVGAKVEWRASTGQVIIAR
ncbi:MAG: carboxyl-terminal processing protease [Clostridia bacterium]|nr:carboxyl-terminal processing protease [Clostridia bacterium]MDN5322860.1 carboxyl-terminal processing protease [Clostridia bacterium]